jgi:hypothetical protein
VLGGALGSIDLPAFGPLAIQLAPGGITTVEDNAFLALFGNLRAAPAARATRVETQARVTEVVAPAGAGVRRAGQRPRVRVALGGAGNGALEWSYRLDRGMWSPYGRSPELSIERRALLVPGRHRIEVRAREVGRPETTDLTPAVLRPMLYSRVGTPASAEARATDPKTVGVGVPGEPDAQGCGCRAGGDGGALGGVMIIVAALLGMGARRGRAAVLLLCLSSSAGCSCSGGDDDALECEDQCEQGEVERGPTGRWNSIAVSGDRVVAAAYEESLGDLVVVELGAEGGDASFRVVDGLPPDPVPTFSPDGYRSGVTEEGPDVGAYTSIAMHDGRAMVSYHDLTHLRLLLAAESDDGWQVSEVDSDPSSGAAVGLYSSLVLGADGAPAIAYMATGLEGGEIEGGRVAQLRYAVASTAQPGGPDDWEVTVLDEVPVSCAGLCGEGTICAQDGEAERCTAASDGCAEPCGDEEACVGDSCVPTVPDPPAYDLPTGIGLFASHALLPDGRPVVVYYDRARGDLVLQSKQAGAWEKAAVDAAEDSDTGMFADALVDADGTVHIAYQDAIGDRLLYTTWRDGAAGEIEVVDDGVRPGEARTHPVGASAAIFTDASGAIAIAYQDGATSDLLIARRQDGAWTRDDLLVGPALDGFHINTGAGEGRSALASYQYDRATLPLGSLHVVVDP